MASQLDICNLALSYLGTQRLTVLDDTTKQGRTFLSLWDVMLDEVLAAHDWKFARKRIDLALDAVAPLFGWLYSWTLPADCVLAREAVVVTVENGVVTGWADIVWDLDGSSLVTNESADVRLRYTYRCTTPGLFSAGFVEALASRFAAQLAFTLSETPAATYKTMIQMYANFLVEAQRQNNRQSNEGEDESDTWIDAR